MKKMSWWLMWFFAVAVGAPVFAATSPIRFQVGEHSFVLPMQNVSGTQLYSFREGKGFPGLESVIYSYKKTQVTAGAAAELGTSKAVPFVGFQFRLPAKFFDTSNNNLYFGAFAAKHPSRKSWRGVEGGLKASVPLW